MRYLVLDRFTAKTKVGERYILPGQVVTLSPALAVTLIEAGKVAPEDIGTPPLPKQGPAGREIEVRTLPPYRIIRSKILGDNLLLANSDEDAQALRESGIQGVAYSLREAQELKGLPPESLRAHHLIKRVFPGSMIEKGQHG